MNTQLVVTEVRKLVVTEVRKLTGSKVENGVLLFVEGQERAIFRSPSQMVIDLHNSFRLSSAVNDWNHPQFDLAIQRLVGNVVKGNVKFFEAGEEYVVEVGHPALTDKNHKFYGKVKEGGKLKAEKGGSYVNGFLTMPKTAQELNNEELFGQVATLISQSFVGIAGIATGAVQSASQPQQIPTTMPAELPAEVD